MEPIPESVKQQPLSVPVGRRNLKHLRGWLAFFWISLVLIIPLSAAYSATDAVMLAMRVSARLPGLALISVVDAALVLGLGVFALYTGAALITRTRSAVAGAKAFLWVQLLCQVFRAFLPFAAGLSAAANQAMLPLVVQGALASGVYFAFWYSYLRLSRRVARTYQLDGAAVAPVGASPNLTSPPVAPVTVGGRRRIWRGVLGWALIVLGTLGLLSGLFAIMVASGELFEPGASLVENAFVVLIVVVSPSIVCALMLVGGTRLVRRQDADSPSNADRLVDGASA